MATPLAWNRSTRSKTDVKAGMSSLIDLGCRPTSSLRAAFTLSKNDPRRAFLSFLWLMRRNAAGRSVIWSPNKTTQHFTVDILKTGEKLHKGPGGKDTEIQMASTYMDTKQYTFGVDSQIHRLISRGLSSVLRTPKSRCPPIEIAFTVKQTSIHITRHIWLLVQTEVVGNAWVTENRIPQVCPGFGKRGWVVTYHAFQNDQQRWMNIADPWNTLFRRHMAHASGNVGWCLTILRLAWYRGRDLSRMTAVSYDICWIYQISLEHQGHRLE